MTAQPLSVTWVNRLSLPGMPSLPSGYYRSKLFIAPLTANPLLAAAGPLFSLLERLNLTQVLPSVSLLQQDIEHELQAFHSQLHGKKHSEHFEGMAYYLLSTTIDELIGKNYLRLYGKVVPFKAFTPASQNELAPQQGFFTLVNFIQENPSQYLDLIELAYYCLITGFEGEQHDRPEGKQVLDDLIETLYQLIKRHRTITKTQPRPSLSAPVQTWQPSRKSRGLVLSAFFATTILIGSYALSHYSLQTQAKMLQLPAALSEVMPS
ncbi:MAG: DotU family type IV/VI secretion system protein [Legionella sp.]|nr:DotU family type IV/VI secretion system protein [Legionella sp.]